MQEALRVFRKKTSRKLQVLSNLRKKWQEEKTAERGITLVGKSNAILSKYKFDAEGLAEEFLRFYFSSRQRQFPINPFQVLSDLGLSFVFRNLDKLEGAFFSEGNDEIFLVVLNVKPRYPESFCMVVNRGIL